jgi:uncharacterized protein (TIRG00374 family)
MNTNLRTKVLWSLTFALLVYVALVLYGDWQALTHILSGFPWLWLPAILGLTLMNYIGRLIKWHWYLGLINVKIGWFDSARIFGVGMIMVMTPGKVGEFLKSYMVKNVTGAPMRVTAPIVLAERMTDGLAMLILASIGLFAFPDAATRWIAGLILLAILSIVAVVQTRPLALWFLGMANRLPVVRRFSSGLSDFYESSYTLFRPRNFLISVSIGSVSWLCEGLAYYLVLVGIGATPDVRTAFVAVFIFSISTVIGAVFATPGGLGGTEGGLVALSEELFHLGRTQATAGALLVRFATLWFGVLIGVIRLLLWPELLAGTRAETGEEPESLPSTGAIAKETV